MRSKPKLAKLGLLISVLFTLRVQALELSDNFSSLDYANTVSSSGVWNIASGVLQPTIKVTGWAPGVGDTDLDVGDGSHGAFNSSTYAQFSENGDVSGQIIRLNTDTYPALKVTSFQLDSGWTLQPMGSNPLVIRSLSTVVINGTINCSGEDGEGVYNTDYNTVRLGGAGRCGGGAGGNGGANGTASTSGTSGGTNVTGGAGGVATVGANGGDGGGGGGAYSQNGTQADNGVKPPAAVGGARGTNHQDDAFTIVGVGNGVGAGSGGGGGGVYDQADPDRSSGGGGGGGGGVVLITALGNITISASGAVRANGGNGGGAGAGLGKAGGGGGGGGGSIMIMTIGSVTLAGPVTAREGIGGVSDGGDGGKGAQGRTWIAAKSGGITGNTEDPASQLVSTGEVVSNTGNFEFISRVIDMRNSYPTFLSSAFTSTLPGASAVSLLLAGSHDGVTFTDFSSTLSNSNGYRFIKFKILLTSSVAANPALIDSMTIIYDGRVQDNFQFTVTGCGSIEPPQTFERVTSLLFLLLLPLTLAVRLRFKH